MNRRSFLTTLLAPLCAPLACWCDRSKGECSFTLPGSNPGEEPLDFQWVQGPDGTMWKVRTPADRYWVHSHTIDPTSREIVETIEEVKPLRHANIAQWMKAMDRFNQDPMIRVIADEMERTMIKAFRHG